MVDQAGLTVRELKARDVRTVARVIAPELKNLATAQDQDASKLGINTVVSILERHTDELWGWLADMAGMSVDELDDQPLDTPLQIIQAIAEDEQIGPFAKQLQALVQQAPSASGTASAQDTDGTTGTSTNSARAA